MGLSWVDNEQDAVIKKVTVPYVGVSENGGPCYSTLNSKILIIRTPKRGTPNFRKLPYFGGKRIRKPETDPPAPNGDLGGVRGFKVIVLYREVVKIMVPFGYPK